MKGTERAGGVAGWSNGTIENCSVSGSVISTGSNSDAGGVVGDNSSGGTVTACYSTGAVTGSYAGGVVGWNLGGGTVTACYSTGAVSGSYAGGVVSINDGTVTACYHAGTVQGGSGNTGGVVGRNPNGTVTACYWSGADGEVKNSENTKVTGGWNDAVNGAEGLTGMNAAILEWNSNNPGNLCNYHYDDSKAPPELAPGAPTSTTTP